MDNRRLQAMKEKNFGVTSEEFNLMVANMKQGNENLFEQIFLSHFEKCLIYLKRNYDITHEESYDTCMETLLDFRKGLLNDKYTYGNLSFLFTRMASQRFFKTSKSMKNIHSLSTHESEVKTIASEEKMDEEEITLLNKAWEKLGANCQLLLKNYYYENMKLKKIAEDQSKSPASLRKQKERCLNTLRMQFQKLMTVEV